MSARLCAELNTKEKQRNCNTYAESFTDFKCGKLQVSAEKLFLKIVQVIM